MSWEYALAGLVIGIIIGVLITRIGNSKFRDQQTLRADLAKSKAELEAYRQELVGHFAESAELLNNMARDYRQLYQHMAKSSNNLLPDLPIIENPFSHRLGESEAENDQAPIAMPKDYAGKASGLLRSEPPKS